MARPGGHLPSRFPGTQRDRSRNGGNSTDRRLDRGSLGECSSPVRDVQGPSVADQAWPMTRLSRAVSTTALLTFPQCVDFENSLHLREETVQQPEVTAGDTDDRRD